MTEETFNKAWDLMRARDKHHNNAEEAQRILDAGMRHVDIYEVFRLSDSLRDN